MDYGIVHESFATYASALSALTHPDPNASSSGDYNNASSANKNSLLPQDQDDATTSAVAEQPLALNSHMDLITVAGLLRLPPHPYNHLSLYRVELDYNISHEIIDQLHRCHTVEFDYCDGNYVHKVVSQCLSNPTNNVSTLNFCCDEGELSEEVVDAFCQGLSGRSSGDGASQTSLAELRLTVDLPTDVVRPLIDSINQCTSLQTLDLSRCEFGADDAIEALCDGLSNNTTLQTLSLSHCQLEDYEVAQVATALQHHPALLELSLRMNYAQDEAIDAISNGLIHHTPALQSLDLAQQNPGVLNLQVLAVALADNTTLQTLNLQENFLHNAHVDALVTAMTQNDTLKELNMENCELRNIGFSKLINGLGQFRGVHKLWLKENKFSGCKNCDDVVDAVIGDENKNNNYNNNYYYYNTNAGRNLTLRILDVDDEIMLPKHVRQFVEWNHAGRQFLSPNAVPSSMWPTILARIHQVFPPANKNDNNNEQNKTTTAQPSVGSREEGEEGRQQQHEATNGVPTVGAAAADVTVTTAADILYYMLHGPALFDR